MTTKNTISIKKASEKLAVPEKQLRQSIKPLYPETWETVKSIKIAEFETLAEALRDLAEPEAIEQDAPVDEIEPSEPQSPERPEQSATSSEESGIGESETSLEAATPSLVEESYEKDSPNSDITLAESAELAPQEIETLKVSVIRTFSDFAVDLNRITQALAYSTARKNFANFKEIHSATFRHHAEQYVEDFGQEYEQMLADLDAKCSPSDFLSERGIVTASITD